MDALYLLIPLSILLVLGIGGVLAWSVLSGQFDDLDAEGRRILDETPSQEKTPKS
jgi:cbb3-type cytochrome oxidase maturation protein